MSAAGTKGAAPEVRSPRVLWLFAGCILAPVFWVGQLVLGYVVTAVACYPGEAPIPLPPQSLFAMMVAFDAIALLAALAGGALALTAWLRVGSGDRQNMPLAARLARSRAQLLAMWGLFSSLWFFFAILFNTIASVMAPLCGE